VTRLAVSGRGVDHLPELYTAALHNLLDLNTVTDAAGEPFFRAGAHYPDPWIRDAALNCWFAGSLLAPDVARATLVKVTETRVDGTQVIQSDDQWWDQIVWLLGAWSQYLLAGDDVFLLTAFDVGWRSMQSLHAAHFDSRFGLFRGGALMQDGISGYPRPPYQPDIDSSFVLDFPAAHDVMCLSTNAIYGRAYRILAAMARLLGRAAGAFERSGDDLVAAIDAHLWSPAERRYGYLLHPDGRLDVHHEAAGDALAALFVADPARARRLLATTHREPSGVVNVWPPFDRFDDDHPGRHNVLCWPMVMGLHAYAASRVDLIDCFDAGLRDLERLFGSGDPFREAYHPRTGAVDGGWQRGRHWDSERHQTWSAAAFLLDVHGGLLGLTPSPQGLAFAARIPNRFDTVAAYGLTYRGATLDVVVHRSGPAHRVRLDGAPLPARLVPADLTGQHLVEVWTPAA